VGRIILFWLEKLGTTKWNDGDREGDAKAGSPQVGPLCLLNMVALGLANADPSERWDLERQPKQWHPSRLHRGQNNTAANIS
jgi:hypothetical protein